MTSTCLLKGETLTGSAYSDGKVNFCVRNAIVVRRARSRISNFSSRFTECVILMLQRKQHKYTCNRHILTVIPGQ